MTDRVSSEEGEREGEKGSINVPGGGGRGRDTSLGDAGLSRRPRPPSRRPAPGTDSQALTTDGTNDAQQKRSFHCGPGEATKSAGTFE